MPLSGICECCHEISHALQICTFCGAHVCLKCLETPKTHCKLCKTQEDKQQDRRPSIRKEIYVTLHPDSQHA
jgi:hypothetical protein